ncbi:hypothetical protein BD414DRAFT_484324 [Trametes punicea]|nr:hypothetical protein BD414DRAFT_484324 [Trametes punicea]
MREVSLPLRRALTVPVVLSYICRAVRATHQVKTLHYPHTCCVCYGRGTSTLPNNLAFRPRHEVGRITRRWASFFSVELSVAWSLGRLFWPRS